MRWPNRPCWRTCYRPFIVCSANSLKSRYLDYQTLELKSTNGFNVGALVLMFAFGVQYQWVLSIIHLNWFLSFCSIGLVYVFTTRPIFLGQNHAWWLASSCRPPVHVQPAENRTLSIQGKSKLCCWNDGAWQYLVISRTVPEGSGSIPSHQPCHSWAWICSFGNEDWQHATSLVEKHTLHIKHMWRWLFKGTFPEHKTYSAAGWGVVINVRILVVAEPWSSHLPDCMPEAARERCYQSSTHETRTTIGSYYNYLWHFAKHLQGLILSLFTLLDLLIMSVLLQSCKHGDPDAMVYEQFCTDVCTLLKKFTTLYDHMKERFPHFLCGMA